jgi:hypothetical protein
MYEVSILVVYLFGKKKRSESPAQA